MKKELIRATVNREHGMKRERRLSSRRALALVCSIAVLFSSLYISMSPVLADKLICGQKEHTHSSDCYEEILVCGEEERDPEIVVHREFSGDFSWHTHSDSCRNEAGEIVCGQQEGYYHLHNEWCLDENGNVICGLDEIAPHSHDASCYAEDGTLICRKDDVPVLTCSEGNISEWDEVVDEGHTHTDDCYGLADTPSCGMKEHTHTADCYEPEEKEPEKKEEKEPEKKEPEKKEEKEPEKKESEKNKDQEQEKKDPEKKGEEDSEKKDEKDPEKKDSDQTEGKEQGKTDESGENGKTDDPAETDPNATQSDGEKKDGETPEGEGNPDGTPEGQTGGEQNGTSNPDGTGDGTNENPEGAGEGTDGNPEETGEGTDGNPEGTGEGTDGNPEGTGEGTDGNPEGTGEGTDGNPEGTGEGTDGNPEGTGEGNDGNPEGTGEGTDGNPEGTGEGTDGNPEGTGEGTDGNPEGTGEGTDGNPEGTGEGTDGNPEGTGEGNDGNPEGTGEGTDGNPEGTGEGTDGNPEGTGDGTENANPDGTEGDPALNGKTEGTEGKEGLEGTEGKEGTEGAEGTELGTNATDAEGNMIGEDGQVEGEGGLTDEEGENPEGAEEQEPAEPVNYIVGPLVFPGADYTVTANFGVEALFPEGTTLQVREILPGDAEYEQLAAQAESAVVDDEETSVNMMRFFDITFMTEKGEIEPKAPVNIQITYNEVIPDTVDDMVYTLHFAEEGQAPEVLETKTKSVDAATQVEEAVDTVEFQSGSFSIFVVASVRQNQGSTGNTLGQEATTEVSFEISWYDQKATIDEATVWPVGDSSAEVISITIQKSSGEGTGPNTLEYSVDGSSTGTLIKVDGKTPEEGHENDYPCSLSMSPTKIFTVKVSNLDTGTYTITQNDTVSAYNPPEYEDNIKIKNYGKTFNALIDKKWNDGQASHTEEVVVTLTGTAGDSYSKAYSINLPGRYGDYSEEIIDLPYRGNGKIITYSLTETLPPSLSTDYGYSVTETPTEGGVLYTIKNSRKTFTIQGNVEWVTQASHTLPTSLTLQLKRKEGQSGSWVNFGDPISATPDDWHYHWDNLPQFVDGTTFPREEYIYQLEATNLPEAFTPAVGTEGNQYHLKFVYEVVDVKVTTQWNDDGDRDGKRPGTSDYAPYLKLYIGDIEVQGATPTVTDNHDNTYTVSFGIKDKKKSGNPIDYKIRENKVPGYNTTSTSKYRIVNVGGTFLNTYRPAQTLITVIKRWNDRLDRDGLRADVVTRIELLKTVDGNTDIADSVTVQTADLVWTKVWSGLPVNEGGKPISYSVREIMINANGYTTDAEEPLRVLNGGKVTITDTHIPAPVVPPSRSSTTNRTGTTGTSTGSSSGSSGGSSGGGYYGGGYSSGTKSSIRNVKVFYWLRKQGGEPAAKTASVNHREGEAFAIYSPQIPGYQTNMTLVSGKMGVRDDVYHVIYKPMDYVLTIEFLDEKGETLAKAVTLQKMHIGDEYSVPVPEIAGYRAGLTVVQGIFTGNQRIRVVYIPDEYGYTVIEDYKIPRSFGAMPVNVGECWE